MVTPLSRFFGRRKESRPAPAPDDATPRYARRAILRSLGGGLVAVTLAVIMAMGPNASLWAKPGQGGGVKAPKTMIPIDVVDVIVQDGQLIAVGQVGSTQFPIPLQLGSSPNPLDADCPILNLEIGAITLNLLGLLVETSDICLDITAHAGEGLLGDLLCGISNLLSDGLPLGVILGLLNADELNTLLDGLTDLLDEIFALATSPEAVAGAACNILNLALGPIDLNLLGLQVYLDDCDEGPVTIDITAIPGGGLLGDLLCGLSNLLNGGVGGNALKAALNDVANAILALLA
jgi:hypothetical protein